MPRLQEAREGAWSLSEEVLKLHEALEESRRAGKCQAAPFRKPKVAVLKKPGRKSGDDYGTQARRMIPEKIDDTGHRKSAPSTS